MNFQHDIKNFNLFTPEDTTALTEVLVSLVGSPLETSPPGETQRQGGHGVP